MDPLRPGLGEGTCQLDGVARPLDYLVIGTLVEPDGSLAQDVDGRDHLDLGLQPPF